MTVLSTWRLLLADKTPSEEDYFCALVLGWCVEWVRRFSKRRQRTNKQTNTKATLRKLPLSIAALKTLIAIFNHLSYFSYKHFFLLLMTSWINR